MTSLLRVVPRRSRDRIPVGRPVQGTGLRAFERHERHCQIRVAHLPWPLAFSFARAIQQPALEIWRGQENQSGGPAGARPSSTLQQGRAAGGISGGRGTDMMPPGPASSNSSGRSARVVAVRSAYRPDRLPLTAKGEDQARELFPWLELSILPASSPPAAARATHLRFARVGGRGGNRAGPARVGLRRL